MFTKFDSVYTAVLVRGISITHMAQQSGECTASFVPISTVTASHTVSDIRPNLHRATNTYGSSTTSCSSRKRSAEAVLHEFSFSLA